MYFIFKKPAKVGFIVLCDNNESWRFSCKVIPCIETNITHIYQIHITKFYVDNVKSGRFLKNLVTTIGNVSCLSRPKL